MEQPSLERARQAEREVAARSLVRIPAYFGFYLAILGVTAIARRYALPLYGFGALLFVVSVARMWVCYKWERFKTSKFIVWNLYNCLSYFMAALWGVFCSAIIVFFELGWNSFFVMLVTSGLAASEMPVLSPNFSVLAGYLSLILLPAVLVNLVIVGGLKGISLAICFGGLLVFLLVQGRVEFEEYWARVRENAQLSAMINTLPGTVAWITSKFQYVGVNRRTADLWSVPQDEFVGKPLGFISPGSSLVTFAKALFESTQTYSATEMKRTIAGVTRNYFMFGEKYNYGTEAVVLGLDMTENKEIEKALMVERAQRFFTVRLANLGQVFTRLSMGIHAYLQTMVEEEAQGMSEEASAKLRRVMRLLSTVSVSRESPETQSLDVRDLLESVALVMTPYCKEKGIVIKTECDQGDLKVNAFPGLVAEAVISLLNNALDVAFESKEKWVVLGASKKNGNLEISITDSGKGVPEEIREKIFEPLFTTKDPQHATGGGLSVSVEIAQLHNGRLFLDQSSVRTRFILEIPES